MSVSGQKLEFTYGGYNNYKYSDYLKIPLPKLRAASVKLQLGDSAKACAYLKEAIKNGLYEPIRLNSSYKSLAYRKEWPGLLQMLEKRRKQYQNPDNIEINTTDITNFFKVLDKIDSPYADSILMSEYFLKGSQGLKAFLDLKLANKPETMVFKIREQNKFYNSIRQMDKEVALLIPGIKNATKKLEEYYPESIFPPFYFIIGIFTIGGTPDIGNGLLIGSEFFSLTPQTDTTELSETQKFALYDTSRLVPIVMHELIHIEQKNPWGTTLMEQCIIEGACDFIASLVIGTNPNPKLHEYGNAHEKELYLQFINKQTSTDFSNWLYNGSKKRNAGVPPNLGYYIGFKICEEYYLKNKNIKETIKKILEIEDYNFFFLESGYENKFK